MAHLPPGTVLLNGAPGAQAAAYEVEQLLMVTSTAQVLGVKRVGGLESEPLMMVKIYEPDCIDGFYHERGVLGQIEDHSACPHLMRAVEWFETEGRGCIVMTRYACSLRSRCLLSGVPFTVSDLVLWAYQIAVGLDELHRLGIIHCDVAPASILIGLEGNGSTACLSDFAFAIGRVDGRALYEPPWMRSIDGDQFMPPELSRLITRLQQPMEGCGDVEGVLVDAFQKEVADEKWDMWMYARTLLDVLLPDAAALGVRWRGGLDYDCYNAASPPPGQWWPPAALSARDEIFQRVCRQGRCRPPIDGAEERMLYSLVDAVLGCLRPTPGSRFSAKDVVATIMGPNPDLTGVVGDYHLAEDLVPITADGREERFVRPFAGGFFGDVYYTRIGRSNVRCVLKMMRDHSNGDLLLEEIRLACRVRSDFVVAYLGAVFDKAAPEGPRRCCGFLLEQMDGDLLTHMKQPRFHVDPPSNEAVAEVLRLLLDIARGLAAIHNAQPHPIIHRDLHIRNVLLKEGRAKIADFGCGRFITPEAASLALGQTYQPGFLPIVPPEARTAGIASRHAPSVAYDMYGYGLLTAQLVNCLFSPPAMDEDWQALRSHPSWMAHFTSVAVSRAAARFPPTVGDILQGCLASQEERRPTADAVVSLLSAGS